MLSNFHLFFFLFTSSTFYVLFIHVRIAFLLTTFKCAIKTNLLCNKDIFLTFPRSMFMQISHKNFL